MGACSSSNAYDPTRAMDDDFDDADDEVDMNARVAKLEALFPMTARKQRPDNTRLPYEVLEKCKKCKLSDAEAMVLTVYSTAEYKTINRKLREEGEEAPLDRCFGGSGGCVTTYGEFVDLAKSGMAKLPEPQLNKVYRGVNILSDADTAELWVEGQKITEKGFLSTSYAAPFPRDTLVIFKLYPGHKGRNIDQFTAYGPEKEILFPPGATFTIDKIITRDDDGFDTLLQKIVAADPRFKNNWEEEFDVTQQIVKATMVDADDDDSDAESEGEPEIIDVEE